MLQGGVSGLVFYLVYNRNLHTINKNVDATSTDDTAHFATAES